jgi:proliferating cell nuclear antigen
MDIDHENLVVPDQKYSAVVEMSASEFEKVVSNLKPFGDSIIIRATKGQIQFEASGGETGGNLVTFTSNEEIEDKGLDDSEDEKDKGVQISVIESIKLNFSGKYLTMFAKASKLSDRVRLSISNGTPIVIEYQIDGVHFYLTVLFVYNY